MDQQTMGRVWMGAVEADVVTFAEALRRLGMANRVRDAELFAGDLVAFTPSVPADPNGALWARTGMGITLYSFRRVDAVPAKGGGGFREGIGTREVVLHTTNQGGAWPEAVVPG